MHVGCCSGELQRSRQAVSVAMEFFMVSQRIADGEALLPFVGGLKEKAARTLDARDGALRSCTLSQQASSRIWIL